jgi:heme/copper-type cytochrome/quinol oxidase subunit 3
MSAAFDVAGDSRGKRVMWTYIVCGLSIFGLMLLVGILLRGSQAGWFALDAGVFYSLLSLHGVGMLTAMSFVLLNSGLVLRLIAEPWYQLNGNPPAAATLLALAAISQPAAIALFVFVAWQRVRGPRHPAPGVH